ncbi:MAG: tetratricopeptide (TPR) repeat protein [Pseudohongiellaceae bacterium]
MKYAALAMLIVINWVCQPFSSRADQTDPRLNDLFAQLLVQDNNIALRGIESQIWEIWLAYPNPDVERLMLLGTASMNAQATSDALLIFSQLTESFPNYAEAWNKRATLYYMLGDLDASISDIEKTLALEPRHFGALSGLGLVYIQRNELRKAKQAFEDLVAVHPNSTNAQTNLDAVNESLRLNVI